MPALLGGLRDGRIGIGPIAGIPVTRLGVRIAAQVPDVVPSAHVAAKRLPGLDRASVLALAAGEEAMAQAGAPLADVAPSRAGAVMAAAVGLETFDAAYLTFYGENSNRIPPLTVPRIMPGAAASHLSMAHGLRGPSFSVASACASANHAIGQAAQMIRAGLLDVALTGGADAPVTVGFMKGWEALRVLSPDGCRPFSRDRNGIVIGEAAAVFVLEPWQRATARGAVILAEILGAGMSADAADLTAPDAAGAEAAIRAALADAALRPEDIGYVNAHGTGTRLNDRTEVAALRSVFTSHLDHMAVSSTKSMLGHCMTASGAIELAATIAALRAGFLPPTAGRHEPDPECDVDTVPQSRAASVTHALSNSFAFGGLNASLVVRLI